MLPVATALPEPFDVWERIALDLPALNRSARLRTAVDRALPVDPLAVKALSPAEQRRAYVLFASVAHSYVNGGSVPWAKLDPASATTSAPATSSTAMPELPAQLATPWRAVCAALGVPCVFIATGMDLWNAAPLGWWQQPAVRNFRQSISMSGCRSETGFHAVLHLLWPCLLWLFFSIIMLTMALTLNSPGASRHPAHTDTAATLAAARPRDGGGAALVAAGAPAPPHRHRTAPRAAAARRDPGDGGR
jgi:hypothetical protein